MLFPLTEMGRAWHEQNFQKLDTIEADIFLLFHRPCYYSRQMRLKNEKKQKTKYEEGEGSERERQRQKREN